MSSAAWPVTGPLGARHHPTHSVASHARAAVACAQQFKCREGSNRHGLNDDECRAALDLVLKAREPYPAFSVDRQWTMIASHGAVAPLLGAVDAALLKPPVNVMRLSLHPHGLAPQIVNLGEWRAHLLDRLRRQWRVTRDPKLHDMAEFCE